MPNALVRLPELRYPDNARVDFAPISNALDDFRKNRELEARQQIEQERLGMERERLDITKGAAQGQEDDRQVKIFAGIAQAIDNEQDPVKRQGAWNKFVSSRPTFGPALQRYGIDPADHINGPKFLIAQARGPVDPLEQQERQARINQSQAATESTQTSTVAQKVGLQERMQEVARQQGMYLNASGELSFNAGLVPASFSPGGAKPQGAETAVTTAQLPRETRDQARQRTVEELGPTVKPPGQPTGEQAPGEGDIQRYWGAVYGQKPPSGQKYGRDGGLINMKGAADDKTRSAIKGALEASQTAISDVREALKQTNVVGREWSRATDTGVLARTLPMINIAVRGVLHGISGAQINIPEQEEYFKAFVPRPGETFDRINFKLNHLEFILKNIQKAGGQNYDEAGVKALRDEMRKGLGLEPLDAVKKPQPGSGARGMPTNRGWGIEKLPEKSSN